MRYRGTAGLGQTAPPGLSVVIPTRDAARRLPAVIESLDDQFLSSDRYEIIVVDDHSQDDTPVLVRSMRTRAQLNYVKNPRSGFLAARNYGAEVAVGDFVLFLADDMLAPPTLLEAHYQAHKRFHHKVVRGPVLPLKEFKLPRRDSPPLAFRGSFTALNASVSKLAISRTGGFREDDSMLHQEREFGWRLRKEGWPEKFLREAYAWRYAAASSEEGATLEEQAAIEAHSAVVHYAEHPDLRVALRTGIHPLARFWSRITCGETARWICESLGEGSLGEVPWVRELLDRRIYLYHYHRALEEELRRLEP